MTSLRRVALPALTVAATLLLASCADDTAVDRDDLENETFVSTSVTGRDLVAGSSIQLTFDGDTLAIKAGCNTMSSKWELKDGKLAWSGVPMQTKMACEQELMDQDAWLVELFTEGLTASDPEGNVDLVLEAGDVRIELDEKD